MKALGERQKQLAYRYLVNGALRPAASAAWHAALFVETQVASLIGGACEADHADVTALIKTFERPRRCAALIASIRRFHPTLRIVLVDDSREPAAYPGVEVVRLPFDSGVGAGRKAGLERVDTPFVLNLDDDFFFYRGTLLAEAVQLLRAHDRLDLLGGQVIDLPLFITHDFRSAGLHPNGRTAKIAPGTRIGPVEVMDKVANFFVARTDAVRAVGWDAELKRLDHADFFTRAKGGSCRGCGRISASSTCATRSTPPILRIATIWRATIRCSPSAIPRWIEKKPARPRGGQRAGLTSMIAVSGWCLSR